MKNKYYKERAWIDKKVKQGVSKKELYNSVGMFSNKSKKKIMTEKNLTEEEYRRRYSFLHRVFNILDDEL